MKKSLVDNPLYQEWVPFWHHIWLLSGTIAEWNRHVGNANHVQSKCPLWVKIRHRHAPAWCPLYPRERTCAVQLSMSAKCQKQTRAVHRGVSL